MRALTGVIIILLMIEAHDLKEEEEEEEEKEGDRKPLDRDQAEVYNRFRPINHRVLFRWRFFQNLAINFCPQLPRVFFDYKKT